MDNNKDFNWDEETAKEYGKFCVLNHSWLQWEDFKKTRQLPNKDYEILSYQYGGQVLTSENSLVHLYEPPIHSVKRLSDNEVFNVGDKIEGFSSTPEIIIDKFEVSYFTPNTISAYHSNGFGRNISAWKKIKERKLLFVSQDGKEIFEGDKYAYIPKKTLEWINTSDGFSTPQPNNSFLYFSTEEKAKEYVLMNKPCLSARDVIDDFNSFVNQFSKPFHEHIKELAQQKLNDKA